MEGKSLSKKAIIAIVIIAILVIAAISMVVVFLRDQGETEATAIGENSSNSEQTQDAVPDNNGDNNQGTATQSEEPQQEQTTVADNDGATTTNVGTTTTPATPTTTAPTQQTTTTTDGSTQVATTTTTETIPTQALTLAWSNMTVSGGELLANIDANVTDVTAPVRLATNILKLGESNELREYYVKRGDTIYMYIAVNEELAHNPTFTLINNGKEYVMEDSLVEVRQTAENRWDYSVKYLIPEDTDFVDGEITLRVSNIEDVAGNSIPDENGPTNGHRVFYDGTAPEIHVKGTEGYIEEKENYVGNNEQDIYSKVSFKLHDNYKVVEYEINDTLITGMTPSAWSDANFNNIKEYLIEGTNTIIVRDIAGNEATYTFTYDSIAPKASFVRIQNNSQNNEKYAKVGDKIWVYVTIPNSEAATAPKIKINGVEARVFVNENNTQYDYVKYVGEVVMTEDMAEGPIEFLVYGYKDIAGNDGVEYTASTDGSALILDKTAPYSGNKDAGHPLYILNVSDANRRTWIRDGETLRVEANFNEDMDMSRTPILTIGTGSNTQTAEFRYRNTVNGKRTFVADIKINNDILGLADGTQIPFTVTNAFDLAGNEAVLDNEDVTFTSVYGQVTYDDNAPEMIALGMLNDTHYNEGKDITVATTGDRIRLRVAFKEMLAVNPKVEIIGENGVTEVECTYREQTSNPSANYYMYMADFTITEDMDLPEGEIQFKITEYADAAGNVGDELTQEQITETAYPGVVYDTVAPVYTDLGIFNRSHFEEGDMKVANIGDKIRVMVTFPERLAVIPKVKLIGNKDGEAVESLYPLDKGTATSTTYWTDITLTEAMYLPQGEIQIEVYGYEDAAGNVGATLYNKDINNDKYPYVAFDTVAPEYIKVQLWDKENGETETIRNGQTVRVNVTFNEELGTLPTLTIGKQTVTMKETSDGKDGVIYQADITIAEDESTIPEGRLPFTISGYADKAGNVGKDITEVDKNVTGIIYDRTAPEYVKVQLWDKENGETETIRNGQTVRVNATFNEELGTLPTLTIGKQTVIMKETSDGKDGVIYQADITIAEDESAIPEGRLPFTISGYADKAGNVGKDITEADKNVTGITYDRTAPALRELRVQNFYNPNGKEYEQYSGLTQNPGQNKGIAITVNTTELLSKNPIIVIGGKEIEVPVQEPQFNKYVVYVDLTEDMDLVEGEKIPVTVKGLEDLAGNTGDEVTSTGNDKYYVIFDKTAPKTLANNILKFGESNEQREYYVRPGDSIYMCYTANEELGHNPTFTLINNGNEYVMEDSQVIVKQNPAKAWDYTVIYEIPADTTFVDGEIELKVSNIEDKAGNKREDVNGPTNGHKVYFDTTAPEKLNLGIARNKDEGDTRDQRYAKAGDSIRVLVSFSEKLAVEPKVEIFGKVYDVTYRPKSSIEESNIYYYMADVKIDQNTPEGDVVFKVFGYKDAAGNEGLPLTNADINDGKYTNVIIDNTNPTILPTEDSVSGSKDNYSKIGFKVTDNYGVASYEINGETLILTNGEISYEKLKEYLKEGSNTVIASDEAGNTATYTFNYDATAPTREYSNIMVVGDDSKEHEFYAKVGDKIWVSIGVKEELLHNPTFTLINNGIEYPMDDNLVKASYDKENNRYSYVMTYQIPSDTSFVDGEITFKISDLVDLFGNRMTDETKPSNSNRVFFDKTLPTIVLNGESPITIEAGTEYTDAGAKVTDNIDGFISDNYKFTYANYYANPDSDNVTKSNLTEIDTRKTGLYKIAYIYTDKAGNKKQGTRLVYVVDTTKPTITLKGDANITIEAGTPYKDAGATVTDNSDETIENFKYTNINYYVNGNLKDSHLPEVDVKQPGEYRIGYEYTDKSGNNKVVVRTVIVKDTTAPVIKANGKSQTLKVGEKYTELGATVTDNAYIDADDYNITIHFYDENGKLVYPSPTSVDTTKVGTYKIGYTTKDSSGNSSNVATISVKVVE